MKKLTAVAGVVCLAAVVLAVRSGPSDASEGPRVRGDVLLAQADPLPENPEREPAPARSRPRRLPNYYGQIGLSTRQREAIYNLQAVYADRIEELERQLEALKARRDQDIEAVLSPQQKARLKQLLAAAAKRRAGRSGAGSIESDSPAGDQQP